MGWPVAVCALQFDDEFRRLGIGAKRYTSVAPPFHGHTNHVDTFHSFDTFKFDIFDFVAASLENSATYDFVSLARALPLLCVSGQRR
jgi:hypothetical protein